VTLGIPIPGARETASKMLDNADMFYVFRRIGEIQLAAKADKPGDGDRSTTWIDIAERNSSTVFFFNPPVYFKTLKGQEPKETTQTIINVLKSMTDALKEIRLMEAWQNSLAEKAH